MGGPEAAILAVQGASPPGTGFLEAGFLGAGRCRPLAQPIHSAADLQGVLRRLGGITPDYRLVYELLWAPQATSDSLSYDQMLTAYPDLTQIS
ncbi:MAG TPA: DUF1517 domain-containing protein [Nodosilinea sp.]|nr:DUF1517 domain-containing protein [Nodosilinea sp.]